MNERQISRHHRSDRLGYSIARLAKMTDLSRSLLYEEIAAGRLLARKAGRRTIITRRDAIRWLRSLHPMRPDVPVDGQTMRPEPESANSLTQGEIMKSQCE
jgi:hypothetical protein